MKESDVEEVKSLFMDANSLEICKDLAAKYFNETKQIFEKIKPQINQNDAEFFENLLDFVYHRNF